MIRSPQIDQYEIDAGSLAAAKPIEEVGSGKRKHLVGLWDGIVCMPGDGFVLCRHVDDDGNNGKCYARLGRNLEVLDTRAWFEGLVTMDRSVGHLNIVIRRILSDLSTDLIT